NGNLDSVARVRTLSLGLDGALRSGCSAEETFGAQIFIQFGPMNSVTSAGKLPILTRRGSSLQQAWIPGQRYADDSAVFQRHHEGILSEADCFDSFIRPERQNTHSIPLKTKPDWSPRWIVP